MQRRWFVKRALRFENGSSGSCREHRAWDIAYQKPLPVQIQCTHTALNMNSQTLNWDAQAHGQDNGTCKSINAESVTVHAAFELHVSVAAKLMFLAKMTSMVNG